MRPVVTAAEMRALDRATIEDIGIPAFTLMETAGRAVAHVAMEMLEGWEGERGHVAVVCGPGNNGGDGFVAARVLRDFGRDAAVYLAVGRASIRGDAAAHLAIYERAGGVVHLVTREIPTGWHGHVRATGSAFADPAHDVWRFRDSPGWRGGVDLSSGYGTATVRGRVTGGGFHSEGYREQDARDFWHVAGRLDWDASETGRLQVGGSWAVG